MRPHNFASMLHYVRKMEVCGAVTIPGFLDDEMLRAMLRELESYDFVQAENEKGLHRVRQEFSAVTDFRPGSLFLRARDELQTWLNEATMETIPDCFSGELTFNSLVVQRYEPGPIGVGTHRDGKSFINLIAVIVLEGIARFCICDDREGANARLIRNEPGDLLLMRAPGFLGSDLQPFHFVDRIAAKRTAFALRQKKESNGPRV